MTPNTIRSFLVEFLADELDVAPQRINDDAHLIADLGFDSLSFAVSVAEIQRRFSVALSKEEVFECKTFRELVGLVERHGNAAGSPLSPTAPTTGKHVHERELRPSQNSQLNAANTESESL